MDRYNVFAHSTFRFHGVRTENGKVVAAITEKDAGCFGQSVSYTQDELQTHDLLKSCLGSIERGFEGDNIQQNRRELSTAYEGIRRRKVEEGIALDVR